MQTAIHHGRGAPRGQIRHIAGASVHPCCGALIGPRSQAGRPAPGPGPRHRPPGRRAARHAAGATGWDSLTERLVAASSLPFTVLVLPQVVQNQANIATGNAAALAAISWVAYSAGLAGNALMCTHLAARRERAAVSVQLIGIASGMLILTQLWLAGVMPPAPYGAVAASAAAVSGFGLLRANGALADAVWAPFERLVALVGIVAVPQVIWSAFASHPSILPSVGAAAAAAAWVLHLRSRGDGASAVGSFVGRLPGWLATAMFALSPIPQLVRNFRDLSSLQGLSLGTMHLALLGNAMCVPRALCSRDAAWAVGTTWGCLSTGWAQLLTMTLGTDPVTGQAYMGVPHFAAISAALVAYWLWVMVSDARAKGLNNPLGSYGDVLFGGR